MSKAEELARILNGEAQEIEAIKTRVALAWGAGMLSGYHSEKLASWWDHSKLKPSRTPRDSNARLVKGRGNVKAK